MPPPPPKVASHGGVRVPDTSNHHYPDSAAALTDAIAASPNGMPPPRLKSRCISSETPAVAIEQTTKVNPLSKSRKRPRSNPPKAAIIVEEVSGRPNAKAINGSSQGSIAAAASSAHATRVGPATLLDRILVHRMAGDAAFASGDFSGASRAYVRSLELCGPKGESSLRASLHYNHAVALLCQTLGAPPSSSNGSGGKQELTSLPAPTTVGLSSMAATSSTAQAVSETTSETAPTKADAEATTAETPPAETAPAPSDTAPLLDTACFALTSACDAEPSWAEPHLLLGHARHSAGQPERAMRHFQAALRCKAHAKALRARLPNGVLISNQKGSVATASDTCSNGKAPAVVEASDLMQVCVAPYSSPPVVPPEWCVKESRSKRGRVFFMHRATMETRWTLPPSKPVRFVSGMSSLRW